MEIPRREFLKVSGAAIAAAGYSLLGLSNLAAASSTAGTMLFDVSRCNSCRVCEAACREWNRLPVTAEQASGVYSNRRELSGIKWVSIDVRQVGVGAQQRVCVRRSCMHCTQAACVKVCPAGACTRNEFGAVVVNQRKCVGCNYCVAACPFGAMGFDRRVNRASKCTLCSDRLAVGEIPACALACPQGALTFGRRDVIVREARARASSLRAAGFPQAYVYGMSELEGLGILYLLPRGKGDSLTNYGLPEDPVVPTHARVWEYVFEPLRVMTATAVVLGLISNRRWTSELTRHEPKESQM